MANPFDQFDEQPVVPVTNENLAKAYAGMGKIAPKDAPEVQAETRRTNKAIWAKQASEIRQRAEQVRQGGDEEKAQHLEMLADQTEQGGRTDAMIGELARKGGEAFEWAATPSRWAEKISEEREADLMKDPSVWNQVRLFNSEMLKPFTAPLNVLGPVAGEFSALARGVVNPATRTLLSRTLGAGAKDAIVDLASNIPSNPKAQALLRAASATGHGTMVLPMGEAIGATAGKASVEGWDAGNVGELTGQVLLTALGTHGAVDALMSKPVGSPTSPFYAHSAEQLAELKSRIDDAVAKVVKEGLKDDAEKLTQKATEIQERINQLNRVEEPPKPAEEAAQVFENAAAAQERTIQSPQGRELLGRQLAQEEGRQAGQQELILASEPFDSTARTPTQSVPSEEAAAGMLSKESAAPAASRRPRRGDVSAGQTELDFSAPKQTFGGQEFTKTEQGWVDAEGNPLGDSDAAKSISAILDRRASGEPPRASLSEDITNAPFSSGMTEEEMLANLNARTAKQQGLKVNPEDARALQNVRRPEADAAVAEADKFRIENAVKDWMAKNPDAQFDVSIFHDPNARHNGYDIEGYLDPETNAVAINAGAIKPENIDRLMRHEWAHHTLSSDQGIAALKDFARQVIPAEDLVALSEKYGTKDHLLLLEEWVAKNAEHSPKALGRFVQMVREWLSKVVPSLKLTEGEVANIMLRTLREEAGEPTYTQRGDGAKFRLGDKTGTPEFKEWFKRSAAVDEEGNPQVYYHGTPKEFEGGSFKPSEKVNRSGNVAGHYFTPDAEEASHYTGTEKWDRETGDSTTEYKQGAQVIPVYLSIQKPFIRGKSPITHAMIEAYRTELQNANPWIDPVRSASWYDEKIGTFKKNRETSANALNADGDAAQRVLKAGGYDGYQDGRHMVAFEPTQIKSATGNSGAYDPSNPDIRFSLGEKSHDPVAVQSQQMSKTITRGPLKADKEGFIAAEITKQGALPTVVIGKNKSVEVPFISYNQYANTVFKSKSRNPEYAGKAITLAEAHAPTIQNNYAGLSTKTYAEKNPRRAADMIVNDMADNLLFLHDMSVRIFGQEVVDRMSKWYDGANKIAFRFSDKYDITPQQSAAMLAAFSPQKHWFANVSLAENVMDVLKNHRETVFDAAIERKARASIQNSTGTVKSKRELYGIIRQIAGKKLSEIPDVEGAAVFTRFLSQVIHPEQAYLVTPEGNLTAGSSVPVAWSGTGVTVNAINAFRDGSMQSLTQSIGGGHKVRNFYGNIIDPHSELFYTSDTHNVAASLLIPAGGSDFEVFHNFGNNPKLEFDAGTGKLIGPYTSIEDAPKLPVVGTTITGLQGTYPMYVEAGRRAAAMRNMLPRQMQSITWETVRILFTDDMKTPQLMEAVKAIHSEVKKGNLSLQDARGKIVELAGGEKQISARPPEWLNK